jgi:DNA processing protein
MEMRMLTSSQFPAALREVPEPPERLWLRGTLPPAGTKLLAVVGSRALTRYGREACDYLLEGLAGYPVSIVSGLAFGADATAHQAALRSGLHTIAIPGSGLSDDALYPRTHVSLANEILEHGGALLSEHAPNHVARPYDFPSRNRIMVGLSDAVLIIEAGERSGSLITARLAAEYNRELLCVPHRIRDQNSYGCHLFLRLGAQLATTPEHILEALRIDAAPQAQRQLPLLSPPEQALYDLLAEPLPRDELMRRSGLSPQEALMAIGMLELRGIIGQKSEGWQRI